MGSSYLLDKHLINRFHKAHIGNTRIEMFRGFQGRRDQTAKCEQSHPLPVAAYYPFAYRECLHLMLDRHA